MAAKKIQLRNFPSRREIIYRHYDNWRSNWLASHPGEKYPRVYNYSLRGYIYVTALSKSETAYRGTATVLSMTMIKNHFDEILRYAVLVQDNVQPKNNTNQSDYWKLIILEKKIRGVGTAKLTVGVKKSNNNKEQYCITAL